MELVKEQDLVLYKALEYSELKRYSITLPQEPLTLGLNGILQKMAELDGYVNRVQGMWEEAQKEFTVKKTMHKSIEDAYNHTLAIMIHTGIADATGTIIIDKQTLQKMSSQALREAAALQNPDFANLAKVKSESVIALILIEGYLDAVKSRLDRLMRSGYTLNSAKEVLLHTAPFPQTNTNIVYGDKPAQSPFHV